MTLSIWIEYSYRYNPKMSFVFFFFFLTRHFSFKSVDPTAFDLTLWGYGCGTSIKKKYKKKAENLEYRGIRMRSKKIRISLNKKKKIQISHSKIDQMRNILLSEGRVAMEWKSSAVLNLSNSCWRSASISIASLLLRYFSKAQSFSKPYICPDIAKSEQRQVLLNNRIPCLKSLRTRSWNSLNTSGRKCFSRP